MSTNATFFRRATAQSKPGDQKPWAWHWLPGYKRFLLKYGAILCTILALLGWMSHPVLTGHILVFLIWVGGAGALLKAEQLWRLRHHHRQIVKPMHRVLSDLLDHYPLHHKEWLDVPLNYKADTSTGTVIKLPTGVGIPAPLQKAITELVQHKLRLPDPTVDWHLSGSSPYVVFKTEPTCPDSVLFDTVAEHIRNAPEYAPVVGMTKKGQLVSVNLQDESPHIIINGGSGGGKSYLARVMIAHFLRHGGQVHVFDRKRVSHKWLKDLPGVKYYRDPAAMHTALLNLASEGDRRNRLADHSDNPDLGPRIVVVYEEVNATSNKLSSYWEGIREKDESKRSPAVEALGDLVNMGRQVNINVIAIGQQITARSLGGGDTRESFGIRCMARATNNAWRMLCPEIWPIPKKSRIQGRWHIVAAGDCTQTQVVLMTDQEARGLASERSDQADKASGQTLGTEDLVTQTEAFGGSYERLRKAAQRDPSFPNPAVTVSGGANLYRRVDVEQWLLTRDADQLSDAQRGENS